MWFQNRRAKFRKQERVAPSSKDAGGDADADDPTTAAPPKKNGAELGPRKSDAACRQNGDVKMDHSKSIDR